MLSLMEFCCRSLHLTPQISAVVLRTQSPQTVWFRQDQSSEVLFGAAYRHLSTGVLAVTDLTTPILPAANPSNLFPGPDAFVSAQINATTAAFARTAKKWRFPIDVR